MSMPLTQQHRDLLNTVEECLNDVTNLPANAGQDQRDLAFDEMAAAAHALHTALERDGIRVQHSRSMLNNRRVAPDTVEFYKHIHPARDLIAIARAVP